jgi:hypothetical protein
MEKKPDFDLQQAHKYFATYCFNAAWDLLEKHDRTPEENEQMIRLNQASQWHWTQREDYSRKNASIGYWQASRIYALVGEADNARKYGFLCLEASDSDEIDPFYLGYAYEALARAESVAGDKDKMNEYLAKARETAVRVDKAENRKWLEDDLESIQ